MKLEETKLVITRLEDGLDKDGNTFLKAKGYNVYKVNGKNGYNFFSGIKLYPVSQEQFQETKDRLFSQKTDKPKLKIVSYQTDITTNLTNGRLFANLVCYKYDFATHKLFNKKTLLKLGKENK